MKLGMDQAFAIEMVYQNLRDKVLPIKTAYKISKLTKAIESEMQFYREQVTKILNEYAEKDENGKYIMDESTGNVQIQPEKLDECTKKTKELSNVELDIDTNQKFTLDELAELGLSLQDLTAFEPFIEE